MAKKAVADGCVNSDMSRGGKLERFVDNNYKKAITQFLKNYLKFSNMIDTEQKVCSRHHNRMNRKVKRYDKMLQAKYCAKVYAEEWCSKEYVFKLIKN